MRLRVGTQDTRSIIDAAVKSLDTIWRPGFRYAKAGIMLNELRPNGVVQLNLFDDEVPRPGSEALMSLMDSMNRSGRYSIGFAGKGIQPEWRMKRQCSVKRGQQTGRKFLWHVYADLPIQGFACEMCQW